MAKMSDYRREKLLEAAKRQTGYVPKEKKEPPKMTEAQKKEKAKEAEMKRLQAEKAALEKRGGRKDPTVTKKEYKPTAKPANDRTEELLKKAREDRPTYFKKRK